MTKWTVAPYRNTEMSFTDLNKAKKYLRKFVEGGIFEVIGEQKFLRYYIQNYRIYKA